MYFAGIKKLGQVVKTRTIGASSCSNASARRARQRLCSHCNSFRRCSQVLENRDRRRHLPPRAWTRFTSLQDTLGGRLFRCLLVEHLGEPYEDLSLRDVLDRLGKLSVIASAERWGQIRAMRNTLAHDYPETAEERAERPSNWRVRWPKKWLRCWTV